MGSHTCLSYESEESLLELLKSFFEQGLKFGELCFWVVPLSLGVKGARKALGKLIKDLDRYIEKGQFELWSYNDIYLRSGVFNLDESLGLLAKKESDVLRRGFTGLRVSGDASWLSDADWDNFLAYEKEADKLISGGQITALCTYPAEKLDSAKLFRLSFFHKLVISKRKGKADILMDKRDICK